ncbi:unnamed protein product [Amoebophrya sp. A25]|nr:unnamed protein product [Amoebophrya sp. A25]|eukprot:GSA25T00002200001.1
MFSVSGIRNFNKSCGIIGRCHAGKSTLLEAFELGTRYLSICSTDKPSQGPDVAVGLATDLGKNAATPGTALRLQMPLFGDDRLVTIADIFRTVAVPASIAVEEIDIESIEDEDALADGAGADEVASELVALPEHAKWLSDARSQVGLCHVIDAFSTSSSPDELAAQIARENQRIRRIFRAADREFLDRRGPPMRRKNPALFDNELGPALAAILAELAKDTQPFGKSDQEQSRLRKLVHGDAASTTSEAVVPAVISNQLLSTKGIVTLVNVQAEHLADCLDKFKCLKNVVAEASDAAKKSGEPASSGDSSNLSKMCQQIEKGKIHVISAQLESDLAQMRLDEAEMQDDSTPEVAEQRDNQTTTKAPTAVPFSPLRLPSSRSPFAVEYLASYGLKPQQQEQLLSSLLHTGLRQTALSLKAYYTAGEMEARAWLYPSDWRIDQAAGVIHRDFASTFNAALVWPYEAIVRDRRKDSTAKLKCGKDHTMSDGDIVEFQLNQNSSAVRKTSKQQSSQRSARA